MLVQRYVTKQAVDFDEDDYNLLTDSQNVEHVLKSIGIKETRFNSLFVSTYSDNYAEVWGSESSIPSDSTTYELLKNI